MHDELSVISRLHFNSFSDLIEKGVKNDCHPAGIQVFLWLWTKIFGISEISVRIPFLLMGISCIPLTYILTKKWFNATAGLFASGIVAVSQYTIIYSIIARPYSAGLFFTLLFLIIWTKMVFEQDYRWKNIILFGLFAAACAYIHQFSMLTAFLIAFAGLFLVKIQTYYKYLIACLLAIVWYLPHLPIVLHQIGLGETAENSWLAPPTPRYTLYYLQYLFHFSWITAVAAVIALVLSIKINKELWNRNKIKIGIALLVFIATYAIGYLYSLYEFPVLQYSCMLFAFPFLLLVVVSFIDSTLNIKKVIALLLLLAAMVYSLVVTREHYQFLSKQWYEKSVSKSMEWREKEGENKVACLLNMPVDFLKYYELKKGIHLDNKFEPDTFYNNFFFANKVASLKENYLVVAGLTDMQIEIIKPYYPVLLEYFPCYTSEIYVFAKTGTTQEGMKKINSEEFTWNEPIPAEQEFIPIKECNLSDLCASRFTKILLTFDYKCSDSTANYALVLQTSYKGTIADWRCVKAQDFFIRDGENYRSFLPLRYELLVKDSKRIPYYSVKIFLWNIDKEDKVQPIKCTISTYSDNPYIYGMGENLQTQSK